MFKLPGGDWWLVIPLVLMTCFLSKLRLEVNSIEDMTAAHDSKTIKVLTDDLELGVSVFRIDSENSLKMEYVNAEMTRLIEEIGIETPRLVFVKNHNDSPRDNPSILQNLSFTTLKEAILKRSHL